MSANPRYVVSSVTGFTLTPNGRPAVTIYAVLDRVNCYRVVKEWSRESGWARSSKEGGRQAQQLAEQMNRDHDTWLESLA